MAYVAAFYKYSRKQASILHSRGDDAFHRYIDRHMFRGGYDNWVSLFLSLNGRRKLSLIEFGLQMLSKRSSPEVFGRFRLDKGALK